VTSIGKVTGLPRLREMPGLSGYAGTGVRLRAGALIVEVDADLDAAALQRALTVLAPF